MDGERNYCQQRNAGLRGTVKAGTPKHEYQSQTLLKRLLRMCSAFERGTYTSLGRSNIFYLRFFFAFLLIIVVTKIYSLEANYTTRTQYRVPCTLLHVKYSLYLYLKKKKDKRLWPRHSSILSQAAWKLRHSNPVRGMGMCKGNQALKNFQSNVSLQPV